MYLFGKQKKMFEYLKKKGVLKPTRDAIMIVRLAQMKYAINPSISPHHKYSPVFYNRNRRREQRSPLTNEVKEETTVIKKLENN
jgi:hypothetical protein